MGPLVIAALAGGAYFVWKKMHPTTESGRALGVTSSTVVDKQSGMTFKAQLVESFKDDTEKIDVFLMPVGTRVLTYLQTGSDKSSRTAIMSPQGTDPSIIAAAMRAYGVRPKA